MVMNVSDPACLAARAHLDTLPMASRTMHRTPPVHRVCRCSAWLSLAPTVHLPCRRRQRDDGQLHRAAGRHPADWLRGVFRSRPGRPAGRAAGAGAAAPRVPVQPRWRRRTRRRPTRRLAMENNRTSTGAGSCGAAALEVTPRKLEKWLGPPHPQIQRSRDGDEVSGDGGLQVSLERDADALDMDQMTAGFVL